MITIFDEIVALKDLNLTEKVLLSQIISLSINQTCNAGNKYLAEKMDITETTVSTSLKSLKSKGYLDLKVFPERSNYREIYLNIKGDTLYKFLKDPLTNSYIPYLKSLKHLFKNLNAPIDSKLEIKENCIPTPDSLVDEEQVQEPALDETKREEWAKFLDWFKKQKFKYVSKMEDQLTPIQFFKLVEQFGKKEVAEILNTMENKKVKNKSVYLTCQDWLKRNHQHVKSA